MLKHLKILDAGGCKNLEEISSAIGDVRLLEVLDLSLTKIKALPPSIGNLRMLEMLNIRGCHYLIELPSEIKECMELLVLEDNQGNILKSLELETGRSWACDDCIDYWQHILWKITGCLELDFISEYFDKYIKEMR
ncbi:hypothetical protein SAY86_010051 [Trapa natans]|uniref:Disease resistance R13L4/SHOC-2-like LRR domain-containing protein n=1 Tax=Trapa natans TaxID=22666 RepID=A0AAN7L5M5_TRANT|nr:hypothetical protein SAY86_010051 [Trapa natans]